MIAVQRLLASLFALAVSAVAGMGPGEALAQAQPRADPTRESTVARDGLRRARQLARAGRHDEAVAAYRAAYPDGFPGDDVALEFAQSLAATRAGRDAGAALLAQLARRHPDDERFQVAWAADLSTRRPVAPSTFKLLRELAASKSVLVARQAREAWRRALLAMERVPASLPALRDYVAANPGETAVQERIDEITQGRRTVAPAKKRPAAAERRPQASRDAEAAGNLGLQRLREERHAEAAELFERAQRLAPGDAARWDGLLRTARYWSLMREAREALASGAPDRAEARVRAAMALDPAEPSARELLRQSQAARLRAEAKSRQDEGRAAEAIAPLEEAAALDPADPWLALELARLYAAQGESARGEALFVARLERSGPDTRFAYAIYLESIGRVPDAMATLEGIAPADRSDAMARMRERLTERLARIEEARVRREREARVEALEARAREAGQAGRVDEAAAHERELLALDPTQTWRLPRLANLLDQQLRWWGAGVDWLHRAGSAGKSRLSSHELVLGHREAWTPSGRAFFRVAPTRIAAGALETSDAFEVRTFGSLVLCQPGCGEIRTAREEVGIGLSAGVEHGKLRVDVGATPLGFPVVNLTGGAAYEGRIAGLSYTLDLSRRPVTSSLLSYAGMRDPRTGLVWGGVVSSGARLNLSADQGGDYGAWALAGVHRLTGRNVQDNRRMELMAGAYRRLVNAEDLQLAAGVTMMLWHFAENAGEFTVGHGGYYSPRRYGSIALPVSFATRGATTSFYARASVSLAWSETRRAAYFPTDAALQAQAESLFAAGGPEPFYEGGRSGRSFGRSFSAAVEHRLAAELFVGARLDIERSTHYAPNRLLVYLRVTPDGAPARPMAMPPEAVVLPGFQL